MHPLLGLAALLLAQFAGGAVHLPDAIVPHGALPAACNPVWQRVTGACGPCAAGARLLEALLGRGLPAFCAS